MRISTSSGEGVDLVIKPSPTAPGPDGRLRPRHAQRLGPARRAGRGPDLAEAEERVLDYIRSSSPNRAAPRWPATRSARTGRSWPARCRRRERTCTTATSTSPASRSWSAAGSRGRTTRPPPRAGNHRALADVQESIEELRYYREAVFVPLPGPDSADRQADRRAAPGCADREAGGSSPRSTDPPPPRTDLHADARPVHFTLRGAGPRNAFRASRMVGVAQLVEHLVVVQDGRGFESRHSPHRSDQAHRAEIPPMNLPGQTAVSSAAGSR